MNNNGKNSILSCVETGTIESNNDHDATDRLDSWKEIAAFFNRSVRTVQRWESSENMPVHRHCHSAGGSVYAHRHELEAWRASRRRSGASDATLPVIQHAPVRCLPIEQQSALRTLLEAILQQLGEEDVRSKDPTAHKETTGQSTSEEAVPIKRDSRIAGNNTNGNRIQPHPFLPDVQ